MDTTMIAILIVIGLISFAMLARAFVRGGEGLGTGRGVYTPSQPHVHKYNGRRW